MLQSQFLDTFYSDDPCAFKDIHTICFEMNTRETNASVRILNGKIIMCSELWNVDLGSEWSMVLDGNPGTEGFISNWCIKKSKG